MWPARKIARSSDLENPPLSRECRKARDMMFGVIDGSLSLRQSRRLNEHVADCAECKSELEICRRTEMALRLSKPQPLDARDMLAEFHMRVAASQGMPQTRRLYAPWVWAASAFCICLLGLIITNADRQSAVSNQMSGQKPGVTANSRPPAVSMSLRPQTRGGSSEGWIDKKAPAANGSSNVLAESSKPNKAMGFVAGHSGKLVDGTDYVGATHRSYAAHPRSFRFANANPRGSIVGGIVKGSGTAEARGIRGVSDSRIADVTVQRLQYRSSGTELAVPLSSLRSRDSGAAGPVALRVKAVETDPSLATKTDILAFALSKDQASSDHDVSIEVVDDTRGFTARARIACDNETRDGVIVTVIDADDASSQ